MLEEDSIEFDAFLKKNDEKMQEALKKAEKNTKLKQDKVMEIKKLNTEMGIVRAEVSKVGHTFPYQMLFSIRSQSLTVILQRLRASFIQHHS